ncbi:LIM domain-binding protein 3 [Chelonia mydas]|uniref:LIM domain-binding protein 3 n=1 Tax=Chelonia mydas TaxID=8469 RepID=M7B343_CHEMY|nr:LIM domain-binding protein 3 [Chelonia mydas]
MRPFLHCSSLPVKDPHIDSASPVYQAVLKTQNKSEDELDDWTRRSANLQSKSFRILAQMTGTEYMQDPDEEALRRSSGKENVAAAAENSPTGSHHVAQYVTSSVWHPPKSRTMDANIDKAKPVASKGSVRFGTGSSQREASYIRTGQKAPLTSSNNQSTPVEHAPVSTSSASVPVPVASANQPATATQNTSNQMTPPSATPISVVQDSFSSSFQSYSDGQWSNGVDQRALCGRFSRSSLDPLNRPPLHQSQQHRSLGTAPSSGYSESPVPAPKPRVVTTASIRPSVYQPAMGRSWHPEEFNCAYCKTSLADVCFVEEQNSVYCERCYEQFFAPTCARCNTKIMGEVMHALRQTWHTTCFVCAACKKPFGNSLFHMEDGEPYCEKDPRNLLVAPQGASHPG